MKILSVSDRVRGLDKTVPSESVVIATLATSSPGDVTSAPLLTSSETSSRALIVSNNATSVVEYNRPSNISYAVNPLPAKAVEEETYMSALSDVIQKDFFPDLPRLRAQLAYEEALESGDLIQATSAQQVLDSLSVAENSKSAVTVDQFQACFTSEDNASFNELIQNQKLKEYRQRPHLFPSNPNHDKKLLSLPAAQQARFLTSAPGGLDRREAGGSLTSEKTMTIEEQRLALAAPKMNSLMYFPAAAPVTIDERESMERSTRQLNHHNTRLSGSATSSSDSLTNASIPVFNEPVPYAIEQEASLHWGKIAATPVRIAADAPSFQLPPTPTRELLSQQLLEKASKKHVAREKSKQTPFSTPATVHSQRGTVSRISLLSPAAQRLMSRASSSRASPWKFK